MDQDAELADEEAAPLGDLQVEDGLSPVVLHGQDLGHTAQGPDEVASLDQGYRQLELILGSLETER